MIPGKISHLKAKHHDRVKTLESFCRYEQSRYQPPSKNYKSIRNDENSEEVVLSWADSRVEQIKKKYNMQSANNKHQRCRTMSSAENYASYKQRRPLRERDYSNTIISSDKVPIDASRIFEKAQGVQYARPSSSNYQNNGFVQKPKGNFLNESLEGKKLKIKGPSKGVAETPQKIKALKKSQYVPEQQKVHFHQSIDSQKQDFENSRRLPSNLQKLHKRQQKVLKNYLSLDYEGRISNISLINEKIKRVLSRENQQKSSTIECEDQTRIVERKYHSVQNHSRVQQSVVRKIQSQNFPLSQRKQQFGRNQQQKLNGNQSRPRQISPEKVASQIQTIQKKIEAIEHSKRRLNIDFKPFSDSLANEKPHRRFRSTNEQALGPENLNDRFQSLDRIKEKYLKSKPHSQSQLLRGQSPVEVRIDLADIKENKSEEFQNQEPHTKTEQIQLQTQDKQQKLLDFIKMTKSGIEFRKNKQLNSGCQQTEASENKNKKLYALLQRQIALDEQLRKAKMWYSCKIKNEKPNLESLSLTLESVFGRLQQKRAKALLEKINLSEDEVDPFFSARNMVYSERQLIEILAQSQKHWQNGPLLELKKLKGEQFLRIFDLNRKGCVTAEDMTIFMNFNSDSFYRKRDLFLIFQRVCGQEHSQRSSITERDFEVFLKQNPM